MARSTWHVAGLVVIGFLAAGCGSSGGDRPALLEPMDGAEESLTKADGGRNGDADYCAAPANACLPGEGDCDADAQCQVGLRCGTDNGPQFGMPDGHDVCVQPHCTNKVADADETGVDCGGADCGVCVVCGGTNGDPSFCMAACPCTTGQGDCDGDFQCAAGLKCGTDNGPRFGMPDGYDVCVPLHCVNGLRDADEAGIDCGGADCGTCPPSCAGQVLGLPDSCTSACPCSAGQGDCDLDLQCTTGLRCGTDNGPRFGMPEGFDACVAAHCVNGLKDLDESAVDCGGADCGACPTCSTPNGTPDTCSLACPCPAGGGDCDFDAQCQPGLVCGTDNGIDFGMPDGYDVCTLPSCTNGVMDGTETGVDCGGACGACLTCGGTPGTTDYCTSACPCASGQGDCDADLQCSPGLACGVDNGPRFALPAGFDACVAAHCTNGVRDLDEGGVDCGGVDCGTCLSGDPGQPSATLSSVTVTPSWVPADGSTVAAVIVTVKDSSGSAMPLQVVHVEYTGMGSVQPASAVTDPQGVAAFTVTATAATNGTVASVVNPGAGQATVASMPWLTFYALHSVGGVVSGLSGTGLVLAMSGHADLPVSPSASSFTFPTAVAPGTSYAVTVKAQPTGQTCQVLNGTGSVGDADVTGIVIDCAATWKEVAAGVEHTLGVKTDGTLYAWGENTYGQLGDGTTTYRRSPVLVGNGFASASAGQYHSLAIKADGSLYAWGSGGHGQLGDGSSQRLTPTLVGTGYSAAAAGLIHSVALKTTGALFAWGSNAYGQVGNNSTSNVYTPVQIGTGYSRIAAGHFHSVAVKYGTLYAWGSNTDGQLGDGTMDNRYTPVAIGTGYARAAAGANHTVAVKTDGSLHAWGANFSGQLGDGTGVQRLVPVLVGTGYTLVAAGGNFTLALKSDGALFAWGDNYNGQLGDGTLNSRLAPVQVGTGFTAIACGYGHAAGVGNGGSLYTWGDNSKGKLGDGTSTQRLDPAVVTSGFAVVAAGSHHTLALKTDGSLWAWGDNSAGQLGDGTTQQRASPVLIGSGFIAVDAGSAHTVALKTDGSLYSWGSNYYGQLGNGSTTNRSSPGLVGTGYTFVSAGMGHTMALKAGGALYGWGNNYQGQLGNNSTTPRTLPVLIGSGYSMVSAGDWHTVGIKTDGSLHAWGDNGYGQVGDGTTTDRLVPTLVGTGYAAASAGGSHTVALTTDGSLHAWGDNSGGQLGDGTNVRRVAPTLIGTGFASAGAGAHHTVGLKADGSLYTWGFNQDGEVGDGSAAGTNVRSPVLIGTGFGFAAVGFGHTLGITPDGTLWGWGRNVAGQLGDGLRRLTISQPVPHTPRVFAFAYALDPATYLAGLAIDANGTTTYGGAITAYSVWPPLPAGLALDPVTGIVSGTPAASAPTSSFTVTGTGPSGTTTALLTITVN